MLFYLLFFIIFSLKRNFLQKKNVFPPKKNTFSQKLFWIHFFASVKNIILNYNYCYFALQTSWTN